MSNVFPPLELVEECAKFPTRRRVCRFDELVDDRPLCVIDFLAGLRSDGRPTLRTELVSWGEWGATLATAFSDAVGALLGLDDASLAEDVGIVFLAGDVLVGFPHVRVKRPVNAVFDLRPRISLTDHSRDGDVSEGVGVDISVDASAVGDAGELLTGGVRTQPAIVISPWVIGPTTAGGFDLVEEGDIWVVWSGVRAAKIASQRGDGVNQRILGDGSSFKAEGLGIWGVRRRFVDVDISDAQRERQREASTAVGEELDEGDVSTVTRRRSQRLDVGRREDLLGSRPLLVDAGSLNVIGPVNISHIVEEKQESGLIALDGAVGEVVVVAKFEDELMVVVLVKVDQLGAGAFARDANASEIRFQRGNRKLSVLTLQPSCDGRLVGIVDIVGAGQEIPLVHEAAGKVLRVVKSHTETMGWDYYKLATRESTFSIGSERAKIRPDRVETTSQQEVMA